mgnify:CR=1 FL=1
MNKKKDYKNMLKGGIESKWFVNIEPSYVWTSLSSFIHVPCLHACLLFAIVRMVTLVIVTLQKATMVVTNTNNTAC